MCTTCVKIASVTVGSGGASSIDFTSIPSTYTDLCVKMSARNASGTDTVRVRFNNTTSTYSNLVIRGTGTAAESYSGTGWVNPQDCFNIAYTVSNASVFSNIEFYVPNYAGSTNKSISADTVQENNTTGAFSILFAGLWSSTAAINQINLYGANYNFAEYTTATLYGIKNS